jgi:hypothetical protein
MGVGSGDPLSIASVVLDVLIRDYPRQGRNFSSGVDFRRIDLDQIN